MQGLNASRTLHRGERKLKDEGRTLESLGEELGLSKRCPPAGSRGLCQDAPVSLETQSREVRHFPDRADRGMGPQLADPS
jgi:RNA polymerase sigma-32 factor